jgi:DNA-binding NarL/FixJ family response regulator
MSSAARVVIAFPVASSALEALEGALGPGFEVMDIRVAHAESDLVVSRPCSLGAIRSLKRTFPDAQVLVVGPLLGCVSVARLRDAGADLYLAGASVSQLASAIRERAVPAPVEATLVCHRRLAA